MAKTRKHYNPIQSVYWINLDRSVERKKKMIEVFKHPFFRGIQLHRISAFDGKDPSFLPHLKKQKHVHLTEDQTPSIYATTLSHIKAIQAFEQSGEDMAMIFEDDLSMDFNPTKSKLDACIRNAPKDWEVLQLYYHPKGKLPECLYTENTDKHHYNPALAYVIRRKGALRFLQKHDNQFFSDSFLDHHSADNYLFRKLKTYVYKYPLFAPTVLDSTLHPTHLKQQRNSLKQMKRLLSHRS